MPGLPLRYAAILLGMALLAIDGVHAETGASADRTLAERTADVGFRLAVAGVARCPRQQQALGLTFQHLDQFEAADRPALLKTLRLDLGPAVLAVARDSPAERAGILAGDILLQVDDVAVPMSGPTDQPFDQQAARAKSDQIDDQLDAAAAGGSVRLSILRQTQRLAFTLSPIAACPSRIHLAHSGQQNAFADGTHVTVTTGLLRKLKNDDELAFVLGHEMAHNILQHAAFLRAQGVPRQGIKRVLGRNGQLLRATEREADLLGGRLVMDAHYNLYAGAAVLASLDKGFGLSFLSAHDGAGKRIAAVRALVAQGGVATGGRTRE